ncbi:phage tail protein [uncultured Parasutterella sp.]|uniref:phage tail-collar fiber domain-containing protein n=1 Tax=uncultured Parasutterella sp. TaxID=1263098 RepID=UPI002596ECAB|nr:phage tail protein [uncultured Parasutterella sp.]
MAEGVVVVSFRQKIADFLAGKEGLGQIKYMAFGDGGHNEDLTPKPADENATGLQNEICRKELSTVEENEPLSVTGKGVLEKGECVNEVISEAAIYDSNGNLVAIKNFSAKRKESDETYAVSMIIRV